MQCFLTQNFHPVTPPRLHNPPTPDLILPSPSYIQGFLSHPIHLRLSSFPAWDALWLWRPNPPHHIRTPMPIGTARQLLFNQPGHRSCLFLSQFLVFPQNDHWQLQRDPSFPLPSSFLNEAAISSRKQHHLVLKTTHDTPNLQHSTWHVAGSSQSRADSHVWLWKAGPASHYQKARRNERVSTR